MTRSNGWDRREPRRQLAQHPRCRLENRNATPMSVRLLSDPALGRYCFALTFHHGCLAVISWLYHLPTPRVAQPTFSSLHRKLCTSCQRLDSDDGAKGDTRGRYQGGRSSGDRPRVTRHSSSSSHQSVQAMFTANATDAFAKTTSRRADHAGPVPSLSNQATDRPRVILRKV